MRPPWPHGVSLVKWAGMRYNMENIIPRNGDLQMNVKKIIYYLILTALLIVFAVSAFFVGRYVLDSRQQTSRYNELAALVEQNRLKAIGTSETTGTNEASVSAAEPDGTMPVEEPPPILPEYEDLYEINNDLVGWLEIEDTVINYPVMQTPDEPNYYLHQNFDRQYNAHGCLYAAEACDLAAPSDNITIYGHHMKDGSMFAGLAKYVQEAYWETHSYVRFDTLTERHTYQIFAVFRTTANVGGFTYHQFVDAENAEDFDAFIATCKDMSLYDTGITPTYGDKIICLSTCEYTLQNGRLVVAAVRID